MEPLGTELDEDPRTLIETALFEFLGHTAKQLAEIHPAGSEMLEEVVELIEAGGKRIRPLLCYWGHIAAGGAHCEPLLKAAASLELLHTFALLHDDFMDGSAMRRGRTTAHRRAGPGFAVLCGDLAFSLSDALLWSSGFAPASVRTAAYHLHQMRLETLVGQFLDVTGSPTTDAALAAARLKTGAYTIAGPLKVGASLAGADASTLAVMDRYGQSLGEAFQLVDDLAGVFAPAQAGKDPSESGRPATLILRALETAAPEDRETLSAHITGEGDPRELRGILNSNDVPAWARARVRSLVTEAKRSLEVQGAAPLHPSALVVLNQVADSILEDSNRFDTT